ncbi:DUF6602 domain-containing protein [Candidatus Nitrosotenuis cloacae]|uniref:DUF6602 domain-containing protein n=1 Tax=Candidatus Nitrosotenuis cloacae TaxID=1603555 RepID=UPI0022808B7C|nr:DUF6602 domain-containing protein [Candidatus Nitrosotenuis cloacae]
MDLVKIFEEISKKLQSDFDEIRSATSHPGLKGKANEESFRVFLRKYLPKSLDISTGTVVDSDKNVSRELDLIISDAAKTPIFYENNDIRVIPIECVYSVIEIKSNLDSDALDKIFENMLSVRKLNKKAWEETGAIIHSHTMYGKEWGIWPVNYFVFAYDSMALSTLVEKLNSKNEELNLSPWSRIDTICVLNKGVVLNKTHEGMFTPLPDSQTIITYTETKNALLLFHTLISGLLSQARMPTFIFKDYLKDFRF